jgi:hypothetical protein
MAIPPKSIQVDRRYLSDNGHVRKVLRITPDGRVHFETRTGRDQSKRRQSGTQDARSFTCQAEREVPCDWTPEGD